MFPYIPLCFWMKETGCNWTDMISVFLVSEFKSEDIYSRVNYCGKNVCGNFPLWELIFADHWKNCKKSKNFVPHNGRLMYLWLVICLSQIHMYNCLALKTIGAKLYINILILVFLLFYYDRCVHIHLALYGSHADYKYQKGFCDSGIKNALAILGINVTR